MTTNNTVKKIVHSTTMRQQSTTNTLICQSSHIIIAFTLIARVILVYRTPGRPITTHTIFSIHG